jgi:GT2 family glycosyltransferase/glycosyltransferase involved in cell wall biosynthesis
LDERGPRFDDQPPMIRMRVNPEETLPVVLPYGVAAPSVDIVIPVHNEWHVLRPCLESVDAFTSYPRARIVILDDGSDAFVKERIERWAAGPRRLPVEVKRNETALGFVQNANRGFRETRGDLVALLNSDTVVTPAWLVRLVNAIVSEPRIACVMPMSNQCSFHSVDVPMGWNVFQYSADLGRRMQRTCFDAVTVGGFCLLMRREALDDVGLYDEIYGRGYGEESDWCMRARRRGWKVVGAEDVFVYHRGKVSFKSFKDETFREGNYQTFMARFGAEYSAAIAQYKRKDALSQLRNAYVRMESPSPPPVLSAFVDRMRQGGPGHAVTEAGRYVRDHGGASQIPTLVRERGLVRSRHSRHPMPKGMQSKRRPRVTYVLEKFAIAGGVLSIVQLVNRLQLLGWDAKIATHHDHDQSHLDAYMLYHHPYVFPSLESLIENFPESDVVVASLWSTAATVDRIVKRQPKAQAWYFIQDDERNFFHEVDAAGRQRVVDSWGLIPNRIVKTHWLRDQIAEFGHDAHIVPVGFDQDSFYCHSDPATRPLRILAMVRPRTPRRGFERTVRTMAKVKAARPDVEIALFGCPNLPDYRLPFEHTDLGEVPNERLRAIYNTASIVLDLSDYQALGRIGLEGMACGAATVLTKFGGISEYIRDGVNTLAIDPDDEASVVEAVLRLVDDPALRARLVAEGIRTVERFSCDVEARTTSRLFAASLGYENGLPEAFALRDDEVYAPEMAIENAAAQVGATASVSARGRRAGGQ